MILCPFGCGERLHPDSKHANAEASELAKHRRECPKLVTPPAARPLPAPAPDDPTLPVDKPNSTRAHAWRSFAGHALAGLLATDEDTTVDGRTVRLAAEYANQLLAHHDLRLK